MKDPAYVGLGGNVGDVRAAFAAAAARLRAIPGVAGVRLSAIRSTRPVGPVADQPWFLNAAAELRFEDRGEPPAPARLLGELLAIERALGRDRAREARMGPRTLDLDLLVWGPLVVDEPGPPALRLPHPELVRRAFALEPLVELAGPDLLVPGIGGGRAGDLLARLGKIV